MAFPRNIDPAVPAGTDNPRQGDDEFRALKQDVIDLFNLPSATNITAGIFIGAATTTAGIIGGFALAAIADPGVPTAGQVWRSSTTANTLKYYDGTATRSLVDLSLAQTLTSKTLASPVLTTPQLSLESIVDLAGTATARFWLSTTTANTLKYADGTAVRSLVELSLAQTLTNKTLTAPTIGDFTNATHAHVAASSGSALDAAAIATGTLAVARGGTNLGSGTSGGVLGYTAVGILASSALLTANGVLLGGGAGATPTATAAGVAYNPLRVPAAGGAPAFGAIDISQAAAVTGTLNTASGGTGLSTIGTSLQVLRTNTGATALEYATLAAGGLTWVGGDTIERSSATGTAVDLSTISGLSVGVSLPIRIVGAYRKSAGAATAASLGLKLNATQVVSNQNSVTSATNEVENGIFIIDIAPRSASYLRACRFFFFAQPSPGAGHLLTDADMPNVAITSIVITGNSNSASQTIAVKDIHVHTLPTS